MKTNFQTQSTQINQAIEAKNRKAADRSRMTADLAASKQGKSIEQEITEVFNTLTAKPSDGTIVVMERPAKGRSHKGSISIYIREEYKRQQEEMRAHNLLTRKGVDRDKLPKPYRAYPLLRYDFYPRVDSPSRLGSVAIYGSNAMTQGIIIKKRRVLFGHTVVRVEIELGISRPFVNVKIAS